MTSRISQHRPSELGSRHLARDRAHSPLVEVNYKAATREWRVTVTRRARTGHQRITHPHSLPFLTPSLSFPFRSLPFASFHPLSLLDPVLSLDPEDSPWIPKIVASMICDKGRNVQGIEGGKERERGSEEEEREERKAGRKG